MDALDMVDTVDKTENRAPTPSRPERIDVARIMRRIRDESRARESEITRRIEHVRKQLEGQMPQVFDNRLRKLVGDLGSLFSRFYDQKTRFLSEQEPNLANIQRTLAEVNRLIADPAPPLGAYDRWWNPRYWIKRLLVPIRRFVLRRQYEVNALMRDALGYLVNHSAHIAAMRSELELNIHMLQTIEALSEQMDASLRYFQEWPRLSLLHVAEYIDDLYEKSTERQAQVLFGFREDIRKAIEQLAGDWGMRLAELTRQLPKLAPGKAASIVGFDYLAFAEMLRGSPEEVRRRQLHYVQYLAGHDRVLDCGCGRGELLELLRDNGIPAYGVDSDERMVHLCNEKGLEVRRADVVAHLTGLPDGHLGGLTALQLIEHLDFADLFQLLQLSFRKVRPDGVVIFETVNPTCLTTFSGAFYADPTHLRPIHPEAARRLLEVVGFDDVKIEYLSPVDEADQMKTIEPDSFVDAGVRRVVETMNQNIRRINSLLYNYADYAVIGRRPR